jgi:DNA-binding phage protein
MSERIEVAKLPEFDAARHLNSDTAIDAYLTDVLEATMWRWWRQR